MSVRAILDYFPPSAPESWYIEDAVDGLPNSSVCDGARKKGITCVVVLYIVRSIE